MSKSCIALSFRRRLEAHAKKSPARYIAYLAGALAVGSLVSRGSVASEIKAEKARELVRQGLEAEAAGDAAAREKALAAAVELSPELASARWHQGFVENGGQWTRFDEVRISPEHAKALEQYRQIRGDYADDAAGQLGLANWCLRHGLKEQERAHLSRSLDLQPNQPAVRERLGQTLVDGDWLTPRELAAAKARGRQAISDLKRWKPRIERLAAALKRPPGRQRDLALEQIRELRDPSAIVALETVLAPADEEGGMAAVEALAQMHAPEAAMALARLAAFSDSTDVSEAATEKLKQQPLHNFIPGMLSSLTVPGGIRTTVVAGRYGMLFRQAYVLEGADKKTVAVFDNAYRSITGSSGVPIASELGAAAVANRSRLLDAQNRRIERVNERICKTLSEVTGRRMSADPNEWWKWWDELNETILAGEKAVTVAYERELTLVGVPMHHSCLVAGTSIWTDRGAVAVEKIKVGDRVLAQDADSGELAYKPVLRTTVRDKSPLVHVSLPEEQIVASGGHPFWVAGKGWVGARHLQPGMLLHGVDGAVRVEAVRIDEQGDEAVYNLVVEDFHDYFVGKSRLLLHDITPRGATRGPLPGLDESAGLVELARTKPAAVSP